MVLLGGSQSRIIGLAINGPLPNINMTTSGILITVDLKFHFDCACCICSGSTTPGLEVITLPLRNHAGWSEGGGGVEAGGCPHLDALGPLPRMKWTSGCEGRTVSEVAGPKHHPIGSTTLDGAWLF